MSSLSNFKSKLLTVALSEIARHNEIIDPMSKNVREATSYNRPEMLASIRENGILQALAIVKAGPGDVSNPERKYLPLRGFSRREMLELLVTEYPQGYKGDDGNLRKFDAVPVQVYDVPNPSDRLMLKADHGDYRGLSKLEVFNTFEQMYALQWKEKDIVIRMRGSLETNYPPDKKLPEAPMPDSPDYKAEYAKYQTAWLNNFKGTIQTFKRAIQSPVVMYEAFRRKLAKQQAWPTSDELKTGLGIHEADVKADPTKVSVTRENPGEGFRKWWDALVAIKAEAEANGTGGKGKTNAAMNANQIREVMKQLNSPLLKRLVQVLLREIGPLNLPVLDNIAKSLVFTAEQTAIILNMQAAPVEEPDLTLPDQDEQVKNAEIDRRENDPNPEEIEQDRAALNRLNVTV